MDKNYWTTGASVSLEEVLLGRERRAATQQKLLLNHNSTLICFTLNIAGPVKYTPLIHQVFLHVIRDIKALLAASAFDILEELQILENSGCEEYLAVRGDALKIKKLLLVLEEKHSLGRLMDIDVLTPQGAKVSREELGLPQRKCLICGGTVFLCSRSRRHSAEELIAKTNDMMWDWYADLKARETGCLFQKAMIYEVTTTPKPGLVDRWHNGSHKDMDIDLFMDSIFSLTDYYIQCTLAGLQHKEMNPLPLFQKLREFGIQAENAMLKATRGVNTHKGLIFSGGILCGAVGYLLMHKGIFSVEDLSLVCTEMLPHLLNDFAHINPHKPLTHGEHLYLQYGLTGIRGEAVAGFPVTLGQAYPVFKNLEKSTPGLYERGRITLLYLMAYAQDTNIISRSDYQTFCQLQISLREYLREHPPGTFDTAAVIEKLDEYFLEKNISPGGSADLLGVVYFLWFLGM